MTRTTQPRLFHAILFMICVGALPFVTNAQCSTYYADNDIDGHGDAADAGTVFCTDPGSMYSLLNDDCDDSRYDVLPGATEICNGFDDNCDGNTDEGLEVVATIDITGTVHACEGTPFVLTATAGAGYTYQWFRNGKAFENATQNTFSVTHSGFYQVLVSKDFACPVMSSTTTVLVSQAPNAFIGNLSNIDLCAAGGRVKLRANSGGGLSYQWFKNGSAVTGATYILYPATSAGDYQVMVTNASGCSRMSDVTNVYSTCREIAPEEGSVMLSPNPATGTVRITLNTDGSAGTGMIDVYAMTGQKVYSEPVTISSGRIDASVSLPSSLGTGIYMIKVTAGEAGYTSQLNLQK